MIGITYIVGRFVNCHNHFKNIKAKHAYPVM